MGSGWGQSLILVESQHRSPLEFGPAYPCLRRRDLRQRGLTRPVALSGTVGEAREGRAESPMDRLQEGALGVLCPDGIALRGWERLGKLLLERGEGLLLEVPGGG